VDFSTSNHFDLKRTSCITAPSPFDIEASTVNPNMTNNQTTAPKTGSLNSSGGLGVGDIAAIVLGGVLLIVLLVTIPVITGLAVKNIRSSPQVNSLEMPEASRYDRTTRPKPPSERQYISLQSSTTTGAYEQVGHM
jgi:hypothetical protein